MRLTNPEALGNEAGGSETAMKRPCNGCVTAIPRAGWAKSERLLMKSACSNGAR